MSYLSSPLSILLVKNNLIDKVKGKKKCKVQCLLKSNLGSDLAYTLVNNIFSRYIFHTFLENALEL